MPVSEITAPFYAIVRYTTAAYPLGHRFRLYFDREPAIEEDNVATFDSYVDGTHLTGWSLKEVVSEVMTRFEASIGAGAQTVADVEMWRTVEGENEFLGLDGADYSAVTVGSGSGVASSYFMYVFGTVLREQYRLMMFEVDSAAPQRFVGAVPPGVDDDTLGWFMTRSAVLFVTRHNKRLQNISSTNIGYNRRLARTYGRTIIP